MVSVFDEDGDKAPDFLGKVAIPLLWVHFNSDVDNGLIDLHFGPKLKWRGW